MTIIWDCCPDARIAFFLTDEERKRWCFYPPAPNFLNVLLSPCMSLLNGSRPAPATMSCFVCVCLPGWQLRGCSWASEEVCVLAAVVWNLLLFENGAERRVCVCESAEWELSGTQALREERACELSTLAAAAEVFGMENGPAREENR